MSLKDLDIVYFIKDSAYNEELRYSLRSVEQNFPYKSIWFYGGKPCNLFPDRQVVVKQEGKTKWDRVRNMMKMVVENEEISSDFVLFNDDFFVLTPIDELPPYYCGSLADLIFRIERNNNCRPTPYTASLKRTADILYDTTEALNYELHIPMMFNRKNLADVITTFPDHKGTRSLYGNTYISRYKRCPLKEDVKIHNLTGLPASEWSFCSTEDSAFNDGAVGKYLRKMFPNKSRFEH